MKDGSYKFLSFLLIFCGSFLWSLIMIRSGLEYEFGIGFWGANAHDGLWHISLAEGLKKGSFGLPIFFGEKIKNYHIFFDLVLALVSYVTRIPIINLYFQFFPVFFSITIGVLTYVFLEKLGVKKRGIFYSLFFVYFGGSLSWILGKGESAFWSMQAISTLINPPYAFSLILFLLGLVLVSRYKRKNRFLDVFFGSFIFALLFLTKVYSFILVFLSMLILSLREFILNKKKLFTPFFIGLAFFGFVFYLFLGKGNFPFIFYPFWFLETMMQAPDRLGWLKLGAAIVRLKDANPLIKVFFLYGFLYTFSFLVFILGNFGTRLIFLLKRLDERKKDKEIFYFLYLNIALGVFFPTFFVQEGTKWNTIQFLYYSLFLAGLLGGLTIGNWKKTFFSSLIVFFTLPTTFFTLKDFYLTKFPSSYLPRGEKEALVFLRSLPSGNVMTYPFERKEKRNTNFYSIPLSVYETTAYVSAFSGKSVLLEDEMNLDILGIDWRERKKEIIGWFKEEDTKKRIEFLDKYQVKYIYIPKSLSFDFEVHDLPIIKVFENNEAQVFLVK